MKIRLLLLVLFVLPFCSRAQIYNQYFDGADTSVYNSILVTIDTAGGNTWQIGSPHKTIFNSAATVPNVIVTDTVNFYPANDTSAFICKIAPTWFSFGILALQWKQKLDFDHDSDGGHVDYSLDHGASWHTVFNSPYVYNFYGYAPGDFDTLTSGEYAFTGTDTTWRDIWMCFDNSFLQNFDTVYFRFTMTSDSIDTNKEGWMIDNLSAHMTIIHTAGKVIQEGYLNIFPSVTSGIVHIEAQKQIGYHVIENIQLVNAQGQLVRTWGLSPVKFYVDLGDLPDGLYFLKVTTNLRSQTVPVMLQKNR